MVATMVFDFPVNAVRNLVMALVLAAGLALAFVVTVTVVMPIIVGCCAAIVAVLPQIGIVVAVFTVAVKLFQWGG